ncbi:Phospholipase A I [Colletotrichum chlorophyti]|uniref:Phospholipase A I n=1 Tax=Colletotrichum chlorophyti TaxID=708187 RepID=A0A1Q8RDH7_9PEZI|nr:Phospholipase A I [Colletotrichum chlorophyti]
MDLNGVKRRDTTKGPPLRILSLDGGGVRGYSMLIIIQELMHRTFVEIEGRAPRRDEIPKPCDHFDLIVGTGTGGLIALMLGRLRLNLEQCKELYVRLTRMVFETDKTIAGIPYRSTLFKASKLEEAIREAVREHTVLNKEGNDGAESDLASPPSTSHSNASGPRRYHSNASTVSFSARSPNAQMSRPALNSRYGDSNARLYDARENRTKTAVLAMYKGSRKGSPAAILRSYESRKETAPEFDCKIWQAGRATCAIGLAFKPIQIGQSVFHDDGAGTFNPAPEALDEAVINEWPGREIGVFISVGTGRRPKGSDANSHVWYEGFMGEFAEARRKLISKIEGCEAIHERMKKELLLKRNVNIENYYRFNVEVGVGEFGMNEWHRLADISTSTRQYLRREFEQRMIQGATAKLAKIDRANKRFARLPEVPELVKSNSETTEPLAIELPAEVPVSWPSYNTPPSRQSYESGLERLPVPSPMSPSSPRTSGERLYSLSGPRPGSPLDGQRPPPPPKDEEMDRLVVTAPTPAQYRYAAGADKIAIMSPDEHPRWQSQPNNNSYVQQHSQQPQRIPPPLPPKTPLPEHQVPGGRRPYGSGPLPYPLDDEPPPVNMARKPDYRGR